MSAYAAAREGSIFEADEVIKYDKNSSDESDDEPQPVAEPPTVKSPFFIDNESIIFNESDVVLGLRAKQQVMMLGQYELAIERGAVIINGLHYYHAPQKFTIIQTNLQSIPTITSTQVINSDEIEDIRRDDNERFFSSDYKSVLRVRNLSTGMEGICKYHSPFKNLLSSDNKFDSYKNYSFEVITDGSANGINFDGEFIGQFKELTDSIEEVSSFFTIGNKNSGKSTVSKALVNKLVAENPVCYLDLDPGQSEYSKPYCLSITNHHQPIYGFKHVADEDDLHLYYGFTSPQSSPELYFAIVKALYSHYERTLRPKGHHLIINTPGWIKGYGKELLTKITGLIDPDHLILLTANIQDNDTVLQDLKFKQLHLLKGFFIQSRYSASDIRNFNKLVYFHNHGQKYDFGRHLLDSAPLQISYSPTEAPDFTGINGVSVLNFDVGLNFDLEDLPLMLDTSIVGAYLVEHEFFSSQSHLLNYSDSVPYINGSSLSELINYTSSVTFVGACLVHSINTAEHYFNVYFSYSQDVEALRGQMLQGYKLVLVKGDSEIPTSEILMPKLVYEYQQKYKKAAKNGQPLPKLPYVSYNSNIGGVWRIRRNVMRRGHSKS